MVGNREMNGRAYVAAFNFKGRDQQKKVGELSGGERNRVHLAKMLRTRRQRAAARRADQRPRRRHAARASRTALEAFAGCAVVISHDRWFLDRIATHVLAFEGDSQVRWFEGNFSEYEAFRRKELGADADQPHRIKYKPLRADPLPFSASLRLGCYFASLGNCVGRRCGASAKPNAPGPAAGPGRMAG